MKKVLFFLFCLTILVVPVLATTPHTVTFTAVPSTDFAADEVVYTNPSTVSAWGSGNLLNKMYITWDSNSVYIGIDGTTGVSGGNTNDIWIGFSKGNGATGAITSIDPWGKLFNISGWQADYIYHNYCDGVGTNLTNYNFSSLTGGANHDLSASVTQKSNAIGNSEIAIPWSLIGLQNNQVIKACATISGGGFDGPSSLPSASPGIQGTGATDPLNFWLQITATNGSATPLSGAAPNSAATPTFTAVVPVELSNFSAN